MSWNDRKKKFLLIFQTILIRSNGMELSKGTFRMNIRKNFLRVRSIRTVEYLPREVVEASLLAGNLKLDWRNH